MNCKQCKQEISFWKWISNPKCLCDECDLKECINLGLITKREKEK